MLAGRHSPSFTENLRKPSNKQVIQKWNIETFPSVIGKARNGETWQSSYSIIDFLMPYQPQKQMVLMAANLPFYDL